MASVETKALLKSDAELSDSSVSVQLHPLAILSVSDCITRHVLRKSEGPIVGAILGQQSSHQVTMEVAFPCKTVANESGSVVFDEEWFNARLEQCEDRLPTTYRQAAF